LKFKTKPPKEEQRGLSKAPLGGLLTAGLAFTKVTFRNFVFCLAFALVPLEKSTKLWNWYTAVLGAVPFG
jgi:hypothetical protein